MPEAQMASKSEQALQFIENITANADEAQNLVLSEILTRNANVEYLRRHGLDGSTDREAFKKKIPIVGYEDLKPYITRIANGDSSPIVCSTPISEFLTSSGTSGGERKLMPTIEEELERKSLIYSLLMPVMAQFIPGLDRGKGMYFLFVKSESTTPGGHPTRPVLTSYYKSSHFRRTTHDPYTNYTSPNEAILCQDSYQSMYAQLLCGLIQRCEVIRVGSVFASGFIRAIKFLEQHWSVLCNDIRTGVLDSTVSDPEVRQSVGRVLKPDSELADYIRRECKASFQGIIPRLWPNTKYIDVIVTGTMSQYIPALDYYSNNLPIVCTMYASSECYFGINLNPLCNPMEVSYTLIPTMAYFEFLTEEEVVDLVDVEVGKEYELVVTTYAGLYRYRVGDVLRVSGFKNKAPQFNFICRKNVVLSIDSDKTDEVELQAAVASAVSRHLSPCHVSVSDYTSHADTSTIPGHYVLYWELPYSNDIRGIPSSVFEDCCLAVEEGLNSVYRQGRVSDLSIGALEIRIVESGTFDKLMDYAISLGASINQYKTPRCVNCTRMLEVLNSSVARSYFSQKCPRWTPGVGM